MKNNEPRICEGVLPEAISRQLRGGLLSKGRSQNQSSLYQELLLERKFIKGLDLSELLYSQAVKPLMASHFPNLQYSAGLLGPGSDVLGFDTPQSMDHDWGPRLLLFLGEPGYDTQREEIDSMLRGELPLDINGYPTNYARHADGTAVMAPVESGPVNHRVELHTIEGYFTNILNFDLSGSIGAKDWVSLPENHLLMLTAGRVYHDGLGRVEPLRAKLSYYPDDVWLYLLAAQWRRIAQEEAFMGRCGQVGDELGSRLLAARLVRDLMWLCFLMERKYAPYIKWFGSAFARLECAGELEPVLKRVLEADSWERRQTHLATASEFVARKHNSLGITGPLKSQVSQFHRRPFLVIHADRYVEAIRAAITSDEMLALPAHLGALDQFVDSTDALEFFSQYKILK